MSSRSIERKSKNLGRKKYICSVKKLILSAKLIISKWTLHILIYKRNPSGVYFSNNRQRKDDTPIFILCDLFGLRSTI